MKTSTIPKTLALCADKLFTTRELRLQLQKQVDELATLEKELKAHLIDNLPKSDASGVSGKVARVTVVTRPIPQVKDWDALYKYVKRTGAFELLQRRLTDSAVQERWDAGKTIPGIEPFNVVTISMNKL